MAKENPPVEKGRRAKPGATLGAWLGYAAVGSVLLTLALGAFYFVHVANQQALHSQYLLKVLRTSGEDIAQAIERRRDNIGRAIETKRSIEWHCPAPNEDCADSEKVRVVRPLFESIRDKLKLVSGFDGEVTFATDIDLDLRTEEGEFVVMHLDVSDFDDIEVRTDRQKQYISFVVKADFVRTKGGGDDEAGHVLIRVTEKLRPLLDEGIKLDGLLESVVLAQGADVFHHVGAQTSKLTKLPPPRRTPIPEDTTATVGQSEDRQSRPAGPEMLGADIGGRSYTLLIQSFRAPLTDGKEAGWLIGGLVPDAALRSRAMSVPPTLVIVAFAALIVVLLCLPYLRVRFLGLREGLAARDVLVLALTMFAGCSLAALATAHVAAFMHERQVRKGELETVADRISERFAAELNQLQAVLVRRAREVDKWTNPLYPWELEVDPPWWLIARADPIEESTWLERSNVLWQRSNVLSNDETYVHFEMLFGAGDDGMQEWKETIRSRTTTLIHIGRRPYFQRAKMGDLWIPPSGENDEIAPRFVESIRSMTTGHVYAILSLGKESHDTRTIDAIESELLSLIDPVLLPPYRFCVLDADGQVQFHSDQTRNLRENFFEWLDSDWEIKAAVQRRARRHCDVTYRADPISAWLQPLDGTPWTLVVYGDRRHLAHRDLETLAFSASVCVVYFALLVVVGGLIFRVRSHFVKSPHGAARSMWYWPHPRMRTEYAFVLFVLVALIGIWCIGTAQKPTWMPLYVFAVATTGVTLFSLLVGRATQVKLARWCPPDPRMPWPWSYALIVIGILIAFAVLPSLTIYDNIHRVETELFEQHRGRELAARLQSRIQRHADRYKEVDLSEGNRAKIRRDLKLPDWSPEQPENTDVHNSLDIHVPPTWAISERRSRRPREQGRFERWRQRVLEWAEYPYAPTFGRRPPRPNFNEYASRTRGLYARDSLSSNDWTLEKGEGRLRIHEFRTSFLPLGKPANGSESLTKVDLEITCPVDYASKSTAWRSLVFPAIVVTAIVLLLVLLLWPVLRMVYLRMLKYPRSVDARPIAPETIRQLRLRLPDSDDDPPEDDPALLIKIDGHRIRKAASGAELVRDVGRKLLTGTDERPIVLLDQFDYGLDEPEIRRKKLELLEYLITTPSPITIKSSIDPMYFLTAHMHDRLTDENEAISLTRWAAALQDFTTLRTNEHSAQKAREELESELPLKLVASKRRTAVLRQKREMLVAEGWFSRTLREIAKYLWARPEIGDYSRDDIVEQFQDAAGAHYRRLWASCSTDEKVLLHRLAEGGFVNWRMHDTVTSLMRRRLIVAAPDFRLMNQSFLQFVRRAEPDQVFAQWESAAGASTWTRIKVPLLLGLLFVAAFFVVTQRELFVQLIGVLTMVTASVPAFIRLFSFVAPGRGSSAAG